jgi:hypothetical protein
MFPRRYRKSSVRLPIIQDFGVNARSRTSTPAVHTGGSREGKDWVADLEKLTRPWRVTCWGGVASMFQDGDSRTTKSTDSDAVLNSIGEMDLFSEQWKSGKMAKRVR